MGVARFERSPGSGERDWMNERQKELKDAAYARIGNGMS
jgi:hypothetical protein